MHYSFSILIVDFGTQTFGEYIQGIPHPQQEIIHWINVNLMSRWRSFLIQISIKIYLFDAFSRENKDLTEKKHYPVNRDSLIFNVSLIKLDVYSENLSLSQNIWLPQTCAVVAFFVIYDHKLLAVAQSMKFELNSTKYDKLS